MRGEEQWSAVIAGSGSGSTDCLENGGGEAGALAKRSSERRCSAVGPRADDDRALPSRFQFLQMSSGWLDGREVLQYRAQRGGKAAPLSSPCWRNLEHAQRGSFSTSVI